MENLVEPVVIEAVRRALDSIPNTGYIPLITAKSVIGIGLPELQSAPALTRSAFFMPKIYGGPYGALRSAVSLRP